MDQRASGHSLLPRNRRDRAMLELTAESLSFGRQARQDAGQVEFEFPLLLGAAIDSAKV